MPNRLSSRYITLYILVSAVIRTQIHCVLTQNAITTLLGKVMRCSMSFAMSCDNYDIFIKKSVKLEKI